MRHIILFVLLSVAANAYRLNCYHIVTIIQSKDILLYPETEKRLHSLCPSVSAHIVSGTNESYDGVVESLLNRVDGSPIDTCYNNSYEDKLLRKINLTCDDFE
jgi:hypothetical protein